MSVPPSRHWSDLSTRDFAAGAEGWVALLPVAAVEQHGPHLPLGVDTIIVDGIVAETLRRLDPAVPAVVLPTQAVGKSEEHIRFPGTLSVPAETLIPHWRSIGASVFRAGVRRLVFFNAHGGNPPIMEIVARDLRVAHRMLAIAANWYDLARADDLFPADERRHGIHGGAVETSVMLHLRPDLVVMERAEDFRSATCDMAGRFRRLSAVGRPSFAWETQDLHPSGAVGDAASADAERGRKLVARAADGLAELLADAAAFDLDTLR